MTSALEVESHDTATNSTMAARTDEGIDQIFSFRELARIDEALTMSSRETGLRFTLYVGELGTPTRARAEVRPTEASRVRRFLNVYLDGAERVTAGYARAAASSGRPAPDREYQALLGDLERAFTAQHHRLVERDRLALDVDIEVLTARLRQELPADAENRS